MNKTLLKIGIVALPIFTWWAYSSLVATRVIHLLLQYYHPDEMISFGFNINNFQSFSLLNLMPVTGFIVLGLMIYLSIKLWIKYAHTPNN